MRATLCKQSNLAIQLLSVNSPSRADEKAIRIKKSMEDSKRLEQLEKFKKISEQAAHDIRTPLQILSMALNHRFKGLVEEEYLLLRNIANSISKIAQLLLEHSTKEDDYQHILVSQALSEVVKQKEIQYIDRNIEFQYSFDSAASSTFIYGNFSDFERMMSNLIDNSVDSFCGKQGIVKIDFMISDENIKIIIEDNGKGMPQEIANKLMKNEPISTTKKNGYSIGTQQIRDALAKFNGEQLIESTINVGTKITLTIPKSGKSENFVENASMEKMCYDSSHADVIVLDDSLQFVNMLKSLLQSEGIKKVDTYCRPDDFLKNLSKYSADTKIFMDNDFKCDISGEDLAKQLIAQGFNSFYILSGSSIKNLSSKYHKNVKFIEKGSETFNDDIICYAKKHS